MTPADTAATENRMHWEVPPRRRWFAGSLPSALTRQNPHLVLPASAKTTERFSGERDQHSRSNDQRATATVEKLDETAGSESRNEEVKQG